MDYANSSNVPTCNTTFTSNFHEKTSFRRYYSAIYYTRFDETSAITVYDTYVASESRAISHHDWSANRHCRSAATRSGVCVDRIGSAAALRDHNGSEYASCCVSTSSSSYASSVPSNGKSCVTEFQPMFGPPSACLYR